MAIYINEEDKKLFEQNGYNQQSVGDTVNHYRSQGLSDDDIQAKINQRLEGWRTPKQKTVTQVTRPNQDISNISSNDFKQNIDSLYDIPQVDMPARNNAGYTDSDGNVRENIPTFAENHPFVASIPEAGKQFIQGVKYSYPEFGKGVNDLVALLGDKTGLDGLSNFGRNNAEFWGRIAEANKRPSQYQGLEGLSNKSTILPTIAGSIGDQATNIITAAGGGAGGARLAGQLGAKGLAKAGLITAGTSVPNLAQEGSYLDKIQQFQEINGRMPTLEELRQIQNVAIGEKTVNTILETVADRLLFGKLFPEGTATKGLKQIGKNIAQQGITEAGTEAMQEGVSIGAEKMLGLNNDDLAANLRRVGESAAIGGIVGGVTAGGGSLAAQPYETQFPQNENTNNALEAIKNVSAQVLSNGRELYNSVNEPTAFDMMRNLSEQGAYTPNIEELAPNTVAKMQSETPVENKAPKKSKKSKIKEIAPNTVEKIEEQANITNDALTGRVENQNTENAKIVYDGNKYEFLPPEEFDELNMKNDEQKIVVDENNDEVLSGHIEPKEKFNAEEAENIAQENPDIVIDESNEDVLKGHVEKKNEQKPKQYKVIDGKTVEVLEDGSYKELPNKYSKIAPNIIASKEAREAAKNERVENAEKLQANEIVGQESNTYANIAPNIVADKQAKSEAKVKEKEHKDKYSTTQGGKQNQMFNTEQFKNGQQMLFDTSDMPKNEPEVKKTSVTMKSGKDKEIEYVEEIPEGYSKIEGATTAPLGYTWYTNGKSIGSGERKNILVKDKNAIVEESQSSNTVNNDNDYQLKTNSDQVKQKVSTSKGASKKKESKKLDDAGEFLQGNRKQDTSLTWDELKDMNDLIRAKNTTKAKVYPKPTLEELEKEGFSEFQAGVILNVYNKINAKPAAGYDKIEHQKQYVDTINEVMSKVKDYIKSHPDEFTTDLIAEAAKKYRSWSYDYNKSLFDAIFPDTENKKNGYYSSIFRLYPEYNRKAIIVGGNKFTGALQLDNKTLADVMKAIEDSKKAKETGGKVKKEPWEKNFIVLEPDRWNKEYAVANKNSKQVYARYATKEEAIAAAKRVQEKIDAFKDTKANFVRDYVERRENNKNVTTEELREAFGFRGVNFGNWTNEKERQNFVNYAYDSLYDLAELLNLPPKALSLNGQLGLAYGAQGTGGKKAAAAHYIPEYKDINLTKEYGAGSLAHEWWHALDNYFGNQANNKEYSREWALSLTKSGDLRPEVFEALENLQTQIKKAPFTEEDIKKRAEQLTRQTEARIKRYADSLKQNYAKAQNAAELHKIIDDLVENKEKYKTYSWEDLHEITNKFFKLVPSNRDTLTNRGEFSWFTREITRLNEIEELARKGANKTEYLQNAEKADKQEGGKYWSEDTELGARAFAAYIFDKMANQNIENRFLSRSGNSAILNLDAFKELAEGEERESLTLSTTPKGEERKRIFDAFDKLFKTIKTRETEKGVELYDEEFNPIKPITDLISNVNKYFETKEAIKSGSSFEDLSNNNEIFKAIREELENRTDYNGNTLFEHIKDYTFTDMVKADKTPNKYGLHVGRNKAIYINTEAIEALPQNEQTGRFINTVRHEIEHAIQEKLYNDIIETRGLKDSELKIFKSLAEELVKEKPSSNIISTLNSIINKIANKRNLRIYELEALKDYAELKVVNKQKSEYYNKHKDVLAKWAKETIGKSKVEARKVYNKLKQSHKIIVDNYTRFFNNYYNTKYEVNARKTGETKAKEVINANNGRTTLQLPRLSKQRNVRTGSQSGTPSEEHGEASEEFEGFRETAGEEIKQRGAINTLNKYNKDMADSVTDREYIVRGIEKVEKDISNMSEKEVEDILNSKEVSDIKSVALAHNIKDSIKNGEVPISKLNKWASEGTDIGQAMQARKAIAPETLEEAVIKMHTYNTEKAPKAAKKLLKDADKIVNQIKKSNNEIEKEFDNWLKEQESAIKNKKEYSQEGDKLALLKAMEKYREKKALRDKKAQEKAEAKLAKQEENKRKELEKEEENAKKELEKERQALIKAMEKYRSTKERQAIRELERANERKRKAVEKLIEERTIGWNKKKKADLIDNIMKLDENGGLTEDNVCKLINKMFGIKEVTPADIVELKKLEANIKNAKTQREEDVAKGFMQKYILENSIGATWWDKIDSIRYINMLGSTKSRLLDFASTGVYQAVRLADNASVLVLDKLLTKKIFGTDRVTSGFYPVEYAKGFVQGAKEGYYDVSHGINTGRAGETARYDLNRANAFKFKPLEPLKGFPKFKQGVENSFSIVEKFVSGMVRIPDRAFFNGRYNASLIDQLKSRGMKLEKARELSGSQLSEYLTNVATQEEIEQAVNEARENVFQRECAASMAAAKIRSVANGIVPKSGDILFPFIHTTSVISQDVAERIGLGFVKGLKQIHNIRKNGGSTGQIRDAYNSLAKSITGAIIIMLGIGARLAGKDNDSDKTYSDTEVSGEHNNSLNIGKISLNAKDIPFLTIPYNLAKSLSSGDEEIIYKGILKAFDDIVEVNPIASTYKESINQAYKYKKDSAKDVLTEFIANSLYTPAAQLGQNAILRDVRNIIDPYQRETFEPDKPFKTAVNRFKNSTPFLSKSLPVKNNAIGEPVMKNDGNNLVERAVSGLITGHKHIKRNETYDTYNKTLKEAYKNTNIKGKNNILIQKIKHSIDVSGQKYKMNAEEFSNFQRDYGRINYRLRTSLMNEIKNGKNYSDTDFVKEINEIQNSAIEAVKITQLGHTPSKYKNGNYKLHKYTIDILQNYDGLIK